MTITNALKELYVSSGSDVILHTLSLKHHAWGQAYYLVRDWASLNAALEDGSVVTFQRHAFNIQGPDVDETGGISLGIVMDNVGRELTTLLQKAASDENQVPIEVIYRIYLESDTSGPQNDPPLKLYLKSVKITDTTISGVAEMVNFHNRKFPNVKYSKRFRSLHDAI